MVQGLDALNRRWKAIPKRVQANVKTAMEQAAYDVVDDMWTRAPHRTGDLAGSIGWTWGDAPAGTLTIGTVGGKEYGALRITIYAGGGDAFYARYQEFGTVNMPASPFFYPVWRARRRRVSNRITRAINKAFRES